MTSRRIALGATVVLLFALGVLDLVQHYHPKPVVAMALSVLRVLPLLAYRRRPVEAVVFELAAVVVTALVTTPVSPAEPWPWAVTSTAAVTALGGLLASAGQRPLALTVLGVFAGTGALLMVWPGRGTWTDVPVAVVICAVGVLIGDFVHGRRRMSAELAEERQTSAVERELRSVVEERARIARELHDVVAHHMSMITVQAETARFRLPDLPAAAAAEFTDIAKVARRSLSELRGLLSALRDDGADPDRAPQPTLADLGQLVDRIRAAGTPVTLTVSPGTDDLPQVVQLAVYRIVQEALSNVVRHAGAARTWVNVLRTKDKLAIEVTNEAPGAPEPPNTGGHGLAGLRERATLLGGTFEVDRPDGGWRVRAELPL